MKKSFLACLLALVLMLALAACGAPESGIVGASPDPAVTTPMVIAPTATGMPLVPEISASPLPGAETSAPGASAAPGSAAPGTGTTSGTAGSMNGSK